MKYGFIRLCVGVPKVIIGNCKSNADHIIALFEQCSEKGAQFVLFPELCITGYSCGDLFHQNHLLETAEEALTGIAKKTKGREAVLIVGLPLRQDNQLFNSAAVIQGGEILGIVPKTFIPGYKEYYEERWFAPGVNAISQYISIGNQQIPFGCDLLFRAQNYSSIKFGIEICEDLWAPIPPSTYQALAGSCITFNPSASNEIIAKHEYRRDLIKNQSARTASAYIYVSSGPGESTTDVVYGGHGVICEYGNILSETERFVPEEQIISADIDSQKLLNDRIKTTSFMENNPFQNLPRFRFIDFTLPYKDIKTLKRKIFPFPFVPSNPEIRDERCREIFSIQTTGLAKRLQHVGADKAVLGISGGLDSTLALLVTVKTIDQLNLDRKNILGVTMPGFGTSKDTYQNALILMKALGVSSKEIDIRSSCKSHFKDIGHDEDDHDTVYENTQARMRTMILMDLANKIGGIEIGTGDLSELALGWCTYSGDHMAMYGVNAGVPKTLVRYLVRWVADNVVEEDTRQVLEKIVGTPISPELLPPKSGGKISQKTEDIIGPYELHDFFLYHLIRYGASPSKILFLAEHAFQKRYSRDAIIKWLTVFIQRFFHHQFKRSCLPDGPKVGTISLSPRGDWRMPSDAEASTWLDEIKEILT
jgi:NAD+ synthase (glutamine-hydrolysing)